MEKGVLEDSVQEKRRMKTLGAPGTVAAEPELGHWHGNERWVQSRSKGKNQRLMPGGSVQSERGGQRKHRGWQERC